LFSSSLGSSSSSDGTWRYGRAIGDCLRDGQTTKVMVCVLLLASLPDSKVYAASMEWLILRVS
jgi:hypothetical protein